MLSIYNSSRILKPNVWFNFTSRFGYYHFVSFLFCLFILFFVFFFFSISFPVLPSPDIREQFQDNPAQTVPVLSELALIILFF